MVFMGLVLFAYAVLMANLLGGVPRQCVKDLCMIVTPEKGFPYLIKGEVFAQAIKALDHFQHTHAKIISLLPCHFTDQANIALCEVCCL